MSSPMFKTKCKRCGKPMFAYATDRSGTMKDVFCSKACEANTKYDKRFAK